MMQRVRLVSSSGRDHDLGSLRSPTSRSSQLLRRDLPREEHPEHGCSSMPRMARIDAQDGPGWGVVMAVHVLGRIPWDLFLALCRLAGCDNVPMRRPAPRGRAGSPHPDARRQGRGLRGTERLCPNVDRHSSHVGTPLLLLTSTFVGATHGVPSQSDTTAVRFCPRRSGCSPDNRRIEDGDQMPDAPCAARFSASNGRDHSSTTQCSSTSVEEASGNPFGTAPGSPSASRPVQPPRVHAHAFRHTRSPRTWPRAGSLWTLFNARSATAIWIPS